MFIYIALLLATCTAEFADELQSFDECLGEDTFRCSSGACILQTQYCDGRSDCDDGTDENFCADHLADQALCNATHQFLCHDQRHCIPQHWICNGLGECDDLSDEANCTDFAVPVNSTCKGLRCLSDGACVSRLRACDGIYDCADRSDEYREDLCRHSLLDHSILDGSFCHDVSLMGEKNYKCQDMSYCLPASMMCDGIADCRDGSDEGHFCEHWSTMCANHTCSDEAHCVPERTGPACDCRSPSHRHYNTTTHRCEDIDECRQTRPHCSHTCINGQGHFICECDDGYIKDDYQYLCYAAKGEAMLFFTIHNEIKFLRMKSKQLVTVATGIKQAHGVSYDGKHLYWVDMAEGHQVIMRAHLQDLDNTKEVLVGLGLEDPGDISIDWLGQNLYLSDPGRKAISVCRLDGAYCRNIKTNATYPKYITVDPRHGKMYWSDYHSRPVIMSANMDGSGPVTLVDHLSGYPTGLTVDAPNRRLYFVDRTIKVVMINGGQVYSLFDEPFHQPYAIAVFENTVYWSDWTSRTIQTADKLHGTRQKRNILLTLDAPVFGMHIYHPVLMPTKNNPCAHHNCSHLCLLSSESTHVCACPDGMELRDNVCQHVEGYKPQYVVICGGQQFTRLEYNALGNPETHAAHIDIGRVQTMAYDSLRDTLYLYDGQRRTINYINMSDFSLGLTHVLAQHGLDNVVDMDYDYASDTLYVLDAGRRHVEVFSLKNNERAVLYKFHASEVPIAFCLLPDYGKMLVAVVESEQHNNVHLESMGLDGSDRTTLIVNNLKGPHVRLRYAPHLNVVFIADEGSGLIDFIHPEGTGRENYRELSTTVTSLAVTDTYVFWTDRRTPRLFWSDIHVYKHYARRINLSLFPNNTQLLVQATSSYPDPSNPFLSHPCLKNNPCPGVCVQTPIRPTPPNHNPMGYKCLCPTGYFMEKNRCVKMASCDDMEFYCHRSNICVDKWKVCDGNRDCEFGEDESRCKAPPPATNQACSLNQYQCNNSAICIPRSLVCDEQPDCPDGSDESKEECNALNCLENEFTAICIPRSLVCDDQPDCPDGSDESKEECNALNCLENEFTCASNSCILKTWKCDGDEDCNDASDEADCESTSCKAGYFQCRDRECIEMRKRCDGEQDCFDFSDEEECEETVFVDVEEETIPSCEEFEFACELNKSICLPLTARCNLKVECPGGTDENSCDFRCAPHGMFACKQQLRCVAAGQLCNGRKDCADGSDETPDACILVNRTSHLMAPVLRPAKECRDGFLCINGECVEWREVCDGIPHCYDGSDEGGLCSTACKVNNCAHACQPTPLGAQCTCPPGYRVAANGDACEDIDECDDEVCSQNCVNKPGSFICTCNYGYALRSDRRSCKAERGNMSILYVSGNSVRSVSADGLAAVRYCDHSVTALSGLDVDVRANKIYMTSKVPGKLIEVNETQNAIEITNIGIPTKVAVEWITGNVYFVDSTPGAACVRVCDVRKKRCARLQNLPSDATIPSLIVDPLNRLMFYCITSGLESVVWSASLSGHNGRDLATVHNCTGLAVDSTLKQLYVAETGPPHILRMGYNGEARKNILAHPLLQEPTGLAIFEDHIYYLVANLYRLGRCKLYGSKHCETFLYRVYGASTFVISHESVQRNDVVNECVSVKCPHVCVITDVGPKCLCDDGTVAKDGVCNLLKKSELPRFNGWTAQEYASAHRASFTVISIVLVLLVIYLALFVYYHFVYKPRRARDAAYTEVRYQNNESADATLTYNPAADMTLTDGGVAHEFVNPLQFVRSAWNQSFRKNHPIDAGLNNNLSQSPQADFSDTESDFDDKEKLVVIKC